MLRSNTVPLHQVVVIADDLTGACDTAVAFSARGMKTEVMLDWSAIEDVPVEVEVIAVDTESRDISTVQARQKLKAAVNQLDIKRYPHIFKKIDSVFRGNTFEEIVAAVEEFPVELVVMAPAYPKLGRTSKDGIVRVCDLAGERTFAVRDELQASGLTVCHVAAGSTAEEVAQALEKNLRGECQLVYCDAMQEWDLEVVVAQGRKLAAHTLWIGSAGLAHALAFDIAEAAGIVSSESSEEAPTKEHSGSIFFFVGSDHLVTETQVVALLEETDVIDCGFEERASDGLRNGNAFLVRVKRGVTMELDIVSMLGRIHPNDVSCLFMTGGDTATLVCRALGIQSLRLDDEFASGLPRGVAVGGTLAGSIVILKSGGFGDADVLCRIVREYQHSAKRRDEVVR
jgi:uncharacterized protein YgbK (DUF1537 family)